jgi:hypothetical protein
MSSFEDKTNALITNANSAPQPDLANHNTLLAAARSILADAALSAKPLMPVPAAEVDAFIAKANLAPQPNLPDSDNNLLTAARRKLVAAFMNVRPLSSQEATDLTQAFTKRQGIVASALNHDIDSQASARVLVDQAAIAAAGTELAHTYKQIAARNETFIADTAFHDVQALVNVVDALDREP